MIICLARGTYVRPHRHVGKSESFHIMEGELDVVLFEDDGAVREVIRMGSYQSGQVFFYRLMEPRFHTVLVRSPHVLVHETTNGPFDPADTEFATWSPAEGDPSAAGYIERTSGEAPRDDAQALDHHRRHEGRGPRTRWPARGGRPACYGCWSQSWRTSRVRRGASLVMSSRPTRFSLHSSNRWRRRGPLSSLVFLQRYRGHGDSWSGELAVCDDRDQDVARGARSRISTRDGDRSICIVTSNASSFVARNQTLAYHTSKAALRQMARFYAVKLGPHGIRVNVVSPCTFVKPESAAYYAGAARVAGALREDHAARPAWGRPRKWRRQSRFCAGRMRRSSPVRN